MSRESATFAHRRAPTGSAELVCTVGSTPRILGPHTRATEDVLASGTTVIGVRLRPGAAQSVLGVPPSELVDLSLGLDELWGDEALALQDAIAGAAAPPDAAATLERTVAARLADAPALDPLATAAFDRLVSGPSIGLAPLASSLCISERQLRRRYTAAIGLAPKALHRIVRFQRFIALAWTHEQPSAHLARLAAEAGYADQSHLSREAARLEGRSPRTILLESEQRCGCDHEHAASYGPLLGHRCPPAARSDTRAGVSTAVPGLRRAAGALPSMG